VFASLIRLLGWGYIPIAVIAKLPFAMSVVAVMTAVSALRGSYSEAGATAALVGVGTAVSGPLLGAAADRWGQRTVLLILGVANTAALLGLAWALLADATTSVILTTGLLIGLTAPQASSMVRSRWLLAIDAEVPTTSRSRSTSAVLSYESMTDELMFVFGPVIVGVAAVAWGTVSPVVGAAILTAVGITAFALHGSAQYAQGRTDPRPRTRRGTPTAEAAPTSAGTDTSATPGLTTAEAVPTPAAESTSADPAGLEAPTGPAPASLLFRPVVLLPVGGMVAIGLFFGSTLTSLTAYMETLGQADATGILYGVMGVGSAVCALSVVALPEAFSLRARWLVFSLLMLAGCLLYPQGQTLTFFVIALLIMGSGVGPSLVTLFAIASQHAPAGRLTTVMAMMSTGVVVGQSAASALSGAVLDGAGLAVGLWGPAASAALLVALGLAYMWSAPLTRRSRTEVP
jgi:MFS family permease